MDLSTKEGRRIQGQRIQQAAERAGVSLEALARTIGCSRGLIYQYAAGTTLAQPDKMQRIARELGVPLDFFYHEAAADLPPAAPAVPATADAPPPPAPEVNEQALRQTLHDLQEMARAYSSGPQPESNLAACERILPVARQLGDLESEAAALVSLSETCIRLGRFDNALSPIRQAQNLYSRLGNEAQTFACRQTEGISLLAIGDLEGARGCFTAVAEAESWREQWKGLLSLGALGEWAGDYRHATEHLNAAADIIEEHRHEDERTADIAETYVAANRVNVEIGCGDYPAAYELAMATFSRAEAGDNRDQYVESQINIGFCLGQMGRWCEALDWLRRAEAVAALICDADRELAARCCRAEVLAAMGDHAEAKQLARLTLETALQGNSVRSQVMAYRTIATAYLRQSIWDESLYYLQRGRAVAESVKMLGAAEWLAALQAMALAESGETARAVEAAGKVAATAETMGAEHTEALAHLVLAGTDSDTIDHAGRALEIADRIRVPDVQLEALRRRALAYAAGGDLTRAVSDLEAGERILAALRSPFESGTVPDQVLEDPWRLRLVVDHGRLLRNQGRNSDAKRLLEVIHWPPAESLLGQLDGGSVT